MLHWTTSPSQQLPIEIPAWNFLTEAAEAGSALWTALPHAGISLLQKADVLHSISESTNMFLQPLSLLNCKEQAPNPTG